MYCTPMIVFKQTLGGTNTNLGRAIAKAIFTVVVAFKTKELAEYGFDLCC